MKVLPIAVLLLGLSVFAEEAGDARVELDKARAAMEAGQFSEARKHVAQVQDFYYRQPEVLAEALYYEAMMDLKEGGSRAEVSALTELKTLYPDSAWCRKALADQNKDAEE